MQSSRFKQQYAKNASKLHRKIGKILLESGSIFNKYRIYQEYPVSKINPAYPNNRHKFDWVILDLQLVIEGHGIQHDRPVCFGGVNIEQAQDNLIMQKYRDNIKMNAAIEAGYTYIVIPYQDIDILDQGYVLNKYKELYNSDGNTSTAKTRHKVEDSEYKRQQRLRAKEHRQQQYRRAKQYLTNLKEEAGDINEDNRYKKNNS